MVIYIFLINYSLLDAREDENQNADIEYVKSKTNFDLTYVSKFSDVEKISGIKIIKWAPMRKIVLPDSSYPSKEKMIEIKNSPKIVFALDLRNNLACNLKIGKFKSYADSYLAFLDSVPSSRQWKKTLFSGETLENANVITIKKDYNFTAEAYLFYKNCLCCFLIATHNQEISETDYLMLDVLIKNMRSLIDKSFY